MITAKQIKEGDVVEGRITGVQPYGIFVKIDDACSGLVHITELDKIEKENITRHFKIGKNLKVRVLRIKPGGKQAVLKIQRTPEARRRTGAAAFETKRGFDGLADQMSKWIQEAKNNRYI